MECCIFQAPVEKYLLPQLQYTQGNKKCVVIDLDETLVHSSFKVSNKMCGYRSRWNLSS